MGKERIKTAGEVAGQQPVSFAAVTEQQRRSQPPAPPAPAPDARLSDAEVASNLAVRCPACSGVGELKHDEVLGKYAVTCRTHGRYTRWYEHNVDVLTAPVVSREKLKALGE